MRLAFVRLVVSVGMIVGTSPRTEVSSGQRGAANVAKPRPDGHATLTFSRGDRFTSVGRHLVALSPDGTQLVYVANDRLYRRALDEPDQAPTPLVAGTGPESPRGPFFSPDGQWIGFWQGGQLKKVRITGGVPFVLCQALNPSGASWTIGNTILYGQGPRGIWRVSGDGGTPEPLVKVDAGQRANGPQLLPGEREILFTLARNDDSDQAQIVVQSLDTGMRHVVIDGGTDARYVATGHLVYARDGSLLAAPFDAATVVVKGRPVPLQEDVAEAPSGVAHFSVSNSGALAYVPVDAVSETRQRRLVWVDRHGREERINTPERMYFAPRLSPDGTRVALEIDGDIWTFDLAWEELTRLTFGPAFEMVAVWTPQARSLIFSSGRSGRGTSDPLNLFRHAADAPGTAERLTQGSVRQVPYAVTPDGTALVFREHSTDPTGDAGDLMLLPLAGQSRPRPLVQTSFREMNAELSPDGRWLAYQSNESGRDEIYVGPFPDITAGKWRVSSNGGSRPLWARNGQELFYESMATLMRVPVTVGSTFEPGTPTKLFAGPYFYGVIERMYDVSPDGQRFLMIKESVSTDEPPPAARLIVVRRWFEELKRRVPTK